MLDSKRALWLAALLGGWLPVRAGAAAPNAPAVTSNARADAAQELFDQGRALVKAGRAPEACPLFEKSQELDPGLGTEFNLADCYERIGKLASAHALFTRVAGRAQARAQLKRARVARERASAVAPRVSKLVVRVASRDGLRIERDDAELPATAWNVPEPVDPGLHRVRAWGPGLGQWSANVNVTSEGAVYEVTIPAGEESSFFDPLHRKLGLAAAGAGVLGVTVGAVFGLRAITKKSDAERAGCDGSSCSSQASADLRDQARSAGDTATLAMGVGAAGLATAAVLFWLVPDSDSESPGMKDDEARIELHPAFGATGGGLSLRASY